jgi:hypothetical protein
MAMDLNIYDLYNSTVEADAPFVEAILTQLQADLQTNVSNNVMYFVFDLAPYFVEVKQVQKNRVIDRVLYEVRRAGIGVRIVGVKVAADTLETFTPNIGYNMMDIDVQKLEINLRIRKNQEYMKSWC